MGMGGGHSTGRQANWIGVDAGLRQLQKQWDLGVSQRQLWNIRIVNVRYGRRCIAKAGLHSSSSRPTSDITLQIALKHLSRLVVPCFVS